MQKRYILTIYRAKGIKCYSSFPMLEPPYGSVEKPSANDSACKEEDDLSLSRISEKGIHSSPGHVMELDSILDMIVASLEPGLQVSFLRAISNASSSHLNLLKKYVIRTEGICPPHEILLPTDTLPTISCMRQLTRSYQKGIYAYHDSSSFINGYPSPLGPNALPGINTFSSNFRDHSPVIFSASPKSLKPQAVKHYSDATPSTHCHVCCRSSKNIEVFACANIKLGLCRKVVCSRCFAQHNWNVTSQWTCPHCQGICTS